MVVKSKNFFIAICVIFSFFIAYADETNNSNESQINYEFPKYNDLSLANGIIERFSMYNENYLILLYYSINGIREPYKPYEAKLQISTKLNLIDNLFYGIGIFFGYTQTSFFQMYSRNISSPFRDNNYMPEFMFYRALNWKLFGGEFYNIRFGYRHLSNGESDNSSRATDRIVAEIMYRYSDFKAHLKLWTFFKRDPRDINKYMGYSDLILSYKFLDRNHLILTIKNLVHNYKNYKGGLMLEYKFDLTKLSLYMQYFYGYGDNLYQYNIKTQNIGIGFSIKQ